MEQEKGATSARESIMANLVSILWMSVSAENFSDKF
jgi:hypothetical protein